MDCHACMAVLPSMLLPLFLHEHSHLSSEITRGIVHNNLYIDSVLISLAYC